MILLKSYVVALIIFLIVDALWLGLIAKGMYESQIGSIMTDNPNLIAAAIFYLIFIFGLLMFVIKPALAAQSLKYAALYGALFGFIAYATFDLTNLALIKGWTVPVTLADLAWGAFIGSFVCSSTYLIVVKYLG